jgi:predicted membrane protein
VGILYRRNLVYYLLILVLIGLRYLVVLAMIGRYGIYVAALVVALVVSTSLLLVVMYTKTKRGWVMSSIARDMLLGALITTARLWCVGITLAICYIRVRVRGVARSAMQ